MTVGAPGPDPSSVGGALPVGDAGPALSVMRVDPANFDATGVQRRRLAGW